LGGLSQFDCFIGLKATALIDRRQTGYDGHTRDRSRALARFCDDLSKRLRLDPFAWHAPSVTRRNQCAG